MKNRRIALPLATLALALVAAPVLAQEPATPCQQACSDQHKGNLDTLLSTRPAPGTDPAAHRATVLAAIDALKSCIQACDLAPAPVPEPAPAPQPQPRRPKKG